MDLIVNADDLGLCDGVNTGIFEAHDHGIVTSASLMVRAPAAAAAAAAARSRPGLALGLHVDLGEWRFDDGAWRPLYHVVDPDDAEAVRVEIAAQVAAFERLTGRPPTHLDSHQHVHRREPVASALRDTAARLRRPVRAHDVPYCGSFYGQLDDGDPHPAGITLDGLVAAVADPTVPLLELGCHPGRLEGLRETGTMYVDEREQELAVLCEPTLPATLADLGIRLCSYADVAVAAQS